MGPIIYYGLVIALAASMCTHIFASIARAEWLSFILGLVLPPYGVINGITIWFS